jgi:hypothetical protein
MLRRNGKMRSVTVQHMDGTAGATDGSRAQKKLSPRKARRARERALSEGLRYGGGRRGWMLMAGALALSPVLSLIALVVALGRPSGGEVRELVRSEMVEAGSQFPRGDAVMWAGQVARIWGTWDERAPAQREVLLAPYLSQGMNSQAGWNGKGVQQVLYSSVNPEPAVFDANRAGVSVVYQIQDGTWRCVTLPVFTYKPADFGARAPWAFALAGNPVPTACLPRTGAPALSGTGSGELDRAGADDLRTTFLPGFFGAWAASDQSALRQYTVSGLRTMGLGGAYVSTPLPQIGDVALHRSGEGADEHTATVTVTWTLLASAATVTAVYDVPLVHVGAQWFVSGEPTAAAQDPAIAGGGPTDPRDAPNASASTGNGAGGYPNPTTNPVSPGPTFGSGPSPSGSGASPPIQPNR